MHTGLLRLLAAAMIVCGAYFIDASYDDYAKWTQQIALGDPSGAEFYEVSFWMDAAPGFGLLFLGALLLGWSLRRK